jgi:hypothetical protein
LNKKLGCLLNLKDNNATGSRMSNVSSSLRVGGDMGSDMEIKNEVRSFLTTYRNVKM